MTIFRLLAVATLLAAAHAARADYILSVPDGAAVAGAPLHADLTILNESDTPLHVELPASLLPSDEAELSFRLAPPASLPHGKYEVWLGLFQEGVGWFYESGDSVRKLRVVHDARS